MILLIHKNASRVNRVERDGEQIDVSTDPCKAIWHLAENFPEETIFWLEEKVEQLVDQATLKSRTFHERMMVSYAVNSTFLSEDIGYVDQLPFINVTSGVKFPTWRMSSDVGGIKGRSLLAFKKEFDRLKNFDHLLNSVAKVGQQNGLFCYSDPGLLEQHELSVKPVPSTGDLQLFSFVYSHYKTIWIVVLFFCLSSYEKRFPIRAFFSSFFSKKMFGKQVDLPEIISTKQMTPATVDVVIPTIGRARFLRQVIEDLSRQLLLPERVIIVEQNPLPDSVSELDEILKEEWPFEICHIFTHETGACQARNKALQEVRSDWVFLADDDIRIKPEILESAVQEANRLGVHCLNLNCKQEGEDTVFKNIKQWGSFGSGISLLKSTYALQHDFSEVFEHGYGEDVDYGMKLRSSGCDIIYHPELEILHLKAPVGGFRKKPVLDWEKEKPLPKPSPTLMILTKRYYTLKQMRGFKISLFLKFYKNQSVKNPFKYVKQMEERWKRSEMWAERLERQHDSSKNAVERRLQE